jgi:hypothetical protein
MKKFVYGLVVAAVVCVTACSEEDFSSKEYYDYLFYLLSKETHNVYVAPHPYTEGEETLGYFSIGCGGSLSNPGDVAIELEHDTILLNRYNRLTFDIDSSKFARLLPRHRYHIGGMNINFPAHSREQYVKVPIYVDTYGLSPDSIYFVPLAIKSVSGGYGTNPEKFNILYRIAVENYYAEHVRNTIYSQRGSLLPVEYGESEDVNDVVIIDDPANTPPIVETRIIKPLSIHSARSIAGDEKVVKLETPTLAELEKSAIILTVAEDNRVQISSYGTVQVEQIDGTMADGDPWNIYREERINMVDESVNKFFYLRYRYRTVSNADATPPVYNSWKYVQETLKRQ